MRSSEAIFFPNVNSADDDGFLMIGGQLSAPWVLAAYRQGIFPWPVVEDTRSMLAWFSPDPRAIIELDALHVSRRLARRLRSGQYQVTFDQDFQGVVAGCAAPRKDDALTWITDEVVDAYYELHRLGFAHSVEVWQNNCLAGGLYGVALGGLFAGESMFARRTDASKVALACLVRRLADCGFKLFDVQQISPHLTRMGATEVPRHDYLQRLQAALATSVQFSG